MKPKLPKDIKNYAIRKVVTRVLSFVLLEAAVILMIVFKPNLLFPSLEPDKLAGIHILLILLPFVVCKIPMKLIDRSWSGTIVDVKTERIQKQIYSQKGGHRLSKKNSIVATIKKDNGDVITREVASVEIYNNHSINSFKGGSVADRVLEYQKGDRAYHFYGIDKLLIVPEDKNRRTNCVVCGQWNIRDKERCFNCGHTIVKPERGG